MSEKRRGLGRGLGALIPSGVPTTATSGDRPVDVFFPERQEEQDPTTPSTPADLRVSPSSPAAGETPETPTASVAAPPAPSAPAPSAPDSSVPSPVSVFPPAAREGSPSPEAGEVPPFSTSGSTGHETSHDTAPPSFGPPADFPAAPPVDTPAAVIDDGVELVPVPGARFAEIPVTAIRPNPKQPRTVFDEEALAELVHSIREIGVLQPIVVRPTTNGGEHAYELIMGERRWRATREAGLEAIPAIIRETEEDALLRDALLENLHRSNLNALEEAAAYQQLLDDFGCTHEELATRIGRSRPQISNTIRLLRLPPAVQRRVAAGVLSAGHARALLGLEDADAMDKLAQRIIAEGLSVRATEEAVSLSDDGPAAPPRKRPRAGGNHAELDDLAGRLGDRLDTRVKIALGASKGRLSIEFASVEDLNRILDILTPEERGAFKADA